MKARGWITTVLATASVLTAGVLVHRAAQSADHLDSPAVKLDSTIDINDVYTFMDGNNFVAAVTLFPNAAKGGGDAGAGSLFSTTAQYVIHTSSGAAYGATNSKYDIICTFSGTTAPQQAECWAGTNEYAKGDPSTSLPSADGKFKVFAGLRADPFHFNLDGFRHAVATVEGASGLLSTDAGCPILDPGTANALRTQLATETDGGTPNDFFKNFNTLAIVVSLDKSLVTAGGPIVSVWAATHK